MRGVTKRALLRRFWAGPTRPPGMLHVRGGAGPPPHMVLHVLGGVRPPPPSPTHAAGLEHSSDVPPPPPCGSDVHLLLVALHLFFPLRSHCSVNGEQRTRFWTPITTRHRQYTVTPVPVTTCVYLPSAISVWRILFVESSVIRRPAYCKQAAPDDRRDTDLAEKRPARCRK